MVEEVSHALRRQDQGPSGLVDEPSIDQPERRRYHMISKRGGRLLSNVRIVVISPTVRLPVAVAAPCSTKAPTGSPSATCTVRAYSLLTELLTTPFPSRSAARRPDDED